MRDEGYGAGSVFLGFMLGGIVGAGVALLMAPQSGRETRAKIRELAEDAKEKATGYVEGTKEKVSSYVDKGRGLYDEKKSLVKSAIEAGKEAYEKEKERLAKEENA